MEREKGGGGGVLLGYCFVVVVDFVIYLCVNGFYMCTNGEHQRANTHNCGDMYFRRVLFMLLCWRASVCVCVCAVRHTSNEFKLRFEMSR